MFTHKKYIGILFDDFLYLQTSSLAYMIIKFKLPKNSSNYLSYIYIICPRKTLYPLLLYSCTTYVYIFEDCCASLYEYI